MTLLIKNVKILGGEKNFPESADVFINGDKISAIGNFPNKGADEVIEGLGAYLAPGFIDVNTDSDHYLTLFDNPEQESFLGQGVTTIVGGMCGSSLAPLLYGSLESVQKWGDTRDFNVDWHTLREFLDIFGKKPLGVNFATLIGHSTIRRAIAGDQIRDLTKNELAVFGETLRRGLKEGGFGLSTGLGYVHGFRTPYSELKFLAGIAKSYGGVYATHLRKNDSEIGESVDETIRLAKEAGVKTLISHFLPIIGTEKAYGTALAQIEELSGDLDFNFDVYPFDTSLLALYTFLPPWAKNGGLETMLANVKDEWLRPRIEKDLATIKPENFIVAQAPGNDFLVGRTLKELSGIYGLPTYKSTLLKLMETTGLKAVVFYKNINPKLARQAMLSKRSLIASNAASFSKHRKTMALEPERARSTFTKFLSMVQSEKLMPLEEAIKKITVGPARKFGLAGRGVIKEGNFADLAIFSFKEGVPAESTAEKIAEIKYTIVNGKTAFNKDGDFTGNFAGSALKHNGI